MISSRKQLTPIPYACQDISEADIQAVIDVLRSDYLTQGSVLPKFEKTVAEYCGAQHGIAVNSGTSALHIACLALDVGKGDIVWTSPISFIASANCALYCGARVDFVDIDLRTYNMSVVSLREKLEQAERDGKLPKIVIPVHFAGQSCEMREIKILAGYYGFKIIEDASHAIGGKYCGEFIGNCRYSDITIFSFHPVKIITTGEGGMALTNDALLLNRMQRYRSHGITSDVGEMKQKTADEIWNYQQTTLGYNYRMTDIQAALGVSQMSRLEEFIVKRHVIAKRYNEAFIDLPITTPWQNPDSYSSYHLYPIKLNLGDVNKTQRQVYNEMRRSGILVNLHYIPIYRQPYYESMGFRKGYCPEAERYYLEAISIPLYPGLTESNQNRVIAVIHEATGV